MNPMTTREQQETSVTSSTEEQAQQPESQPSPPHQVGAIIQTGMTVVAERVLDMLPKANTRPLRRRHVPATEEQIESLIEALGDTNNPAHARAVQALVDIGPPAIHPLCEALQHSSWLTAYRSAEALGYIADGRATGPLIQALNHPHSNVRWSVVRALSQIGDVRSMLELRQVAVKDTGRTSWGESVPETAQSALDHIRNRGVWGQSIELVKTAITAVLMILALVFAYGVFTALQTELDTIESAPANTGIVNTLPPSIAETRTAEAEPPLPALGADAETDPSEPTAEPPTPTATATPILATVVSGSGNVRPSPSIETQPIGLVNLGDEILVLGQTPDSAWYLIQLSENVAPGSYIQNTTDSEDATGWIASTLVEQPTEIIPIITTNESTGAPAEIDPLTGQPIDGNAQPGVDADLNGIDDNLEPPSDPSNPNAPNAPDPATTPTTQPEGGAVPPGPGAQDALVPTIQP